MSSGRRDGPALSAIRSCGSGLTRLNDCLGSARRYMRLGLAPRTLKSYDAAWAKYSAFCDNVSVPACPINVSVLCAFISSCVDSRNLRYPSVPALVAGVQFHARRLDPSTGSLFSNPSVRLLLQGIKRARPCRRDQRLPLSVRSVGSMVSLLRGGVSGFSSISCSRRLS